MFIEIQPPLKAASGTGVRASVSKRATSAPVLNISISSVILDGLCKNHKNHFRVLIGDNDERGYVKVVPDPAGGFVGRSAPKGRMVVIKIGHLDWLPNERQKSLYCKFEECDGGKAVKIALPSWAFERGHHPEHVKTLGAREKPPRAPRPAGDVTSHLMGDPPPGRSALAEKKARG